MNANEKGKEAVESIDRQIRSVERDLRLLQQSRPAPAIQAYEGKPEALAQLDREISKCQARIETLKDARLASKWAGKRACEAELVPLIGTRLAAGKRLLVALAELRNALDHERDMRELLMQRVRELRVSDCVAPDPEQGVLAAVADGCGIRIETPWLPSCLDLQGDEETFAAVLNEFGKRAKLPGPKKQLPPRPEDQASGSLAAISRV